MLRMLRYRVGIGILLGYFLALLLVPGIGVLAIVQLQRISASVDNLTNDLAVDRGLAKDIVNQALLARFYVHQYARTETQADADHFYKEFGRLEDLLVLAGGRIVDDELAERLGRIERATTDYGASFEEVANLVREQQQIRSQILDVETRTIQDELIALRVHVVSLTDAFVFLALGNAQSAHESMRLSTVQYLDEGDARYAIQLDLSYQQALVAFSELESRLADPVQRQNAASARVATDAYYQGVQSMRINQARLQNVLETMQEVLEPEISLNASEITASIEQEFSSQNSFAQALITQAQFILMFTTFVAASTGLILGIVIIRHFEQQARSDESLRESEERHRTLFEGVPVGLYRSSPSGQMIDANPALVQMLGYPNREALLAVNADEIHKNSETRKRWQTLLEAEGVVRGFEAQLRRRDSTLIWARDSSRIVKDARGEILHFEGSVEDITQHRQAEKALREAQDQLVRREKLVVLGQLSGSIAHELRNPLGTIQNAVYFLNMMLADAGPEIREMLDILDTEVDTAEKTISSLLDFARARPPTRFKVNLNDIIQDTLLHIPLPDAPRVEVVLQLDEDLPSSQVDPEQISQVFGNIFRNGIQAMPGGGRLVIKSECRGDPGGRQQRVTVSIADTGEGIPEENLKKIFEPLFTTKAKGIGLGLALTKALVEGHGGTIDVKSNGVPGEGSVFTIKLPSDPSLAVEGKEV